MKLMTCLLTEVRLFFCGKRVCHRAPVLMLIYIHLWLFLHVPFGVNESVRSECCGGLRISG